MGRSRPCFRHRKDGRGLGARDNRGNRDGGAVEYKHGAASAARITDRGGRRVRHLRVGWLLVWFAGDRIRVRMDLGVAAMKGGRIGTTLAAFWRTLCARYHSQRNRPLSRLDDHLLSDLGITREQAGELDRRHAHQTKSSDKSV
ncbi:DUF1127 domain-containing protein [Rhizobium laguerreae]|nr:DUF1127 domain-containing protein [Rhizobium laguerreae]